MSEPRGVGLTRELGLLHVTMLGVGALIGAGVFVLIGSAAGEAGPALLMVFALNGLIVMFTAMVYAELGSAIPSAGGSYVFVRLALPEPFGFLAGWMSWFAISVAGSLYALGFGSFAVELLNVCGLDLHSRFGTLPAMIAGLGVVALFVMINLRGASETGTAGLVVTALKVLVILVFAAAGIWAMAGRPEPMASFTPFMPTGWAGILTAMGLTYIAFEGAEVIVKAGEETIDPKRTLPKAVLGAVAIVVTVYLLVGVALLGGIRPPGDFQGTNWQWLGTLKELGLAEAARQVLPAGNVVILLGALLSTMSALNAALYSSSRTSFSMGRDRYLPELFSWIHPRLRTPHGAITVSGVLMGLMLVLLPLEEVAAAASLMFLLLYLMVNTAAIVVRLRYGSRLAYGFLSPFFPLAPAVAIAMQLVLAAFMLYFSRSVLATVVLWVALGGVTYALYVRRNLREGAPAPVAVDIRPLEGAARNPVVVALARPDYGEPLAIQGAALARSLERPVLLLHVVVVPEQLPISAGRSLVREVRDDLEVLLEEVQALGVPAELLIRVAHHPAEGILRTLEDTGATLCLLGWTGRFPETRWHLGHSLDTVLKRANCSFVIQQVSDRPVRRILVPVVNPAVAPLAVVTALGELTSTAAESPGRIDVLRLFPSTTLDSVRKETVTAIRHRVARELEVPGEEEVWHLDAADIAFLAQSADRVVEHLVEVTRDYDRLVLGMGPGGLLRREVVGRVTQAVADGAWCAVTVVRAATNPLHYHVQSFFEHFRTEQEEV